MIRDGGSSQSIGPDKVALDLIAGEILYVERWSVESVDDQALDSGVPVKEQQSDRVRTGLGAIQLDQQDGVVTDRQRVLARAGLAVAVNGHGIGERRQAAQRTDGVDSRT